jgi:hypothetical protein
MRRLFVACFLFFVLAAFAIAQEAPVKRAAFDAGSPDQLPATDVPADQLGKSFRLLGKLKQPLGEVVKVQGLVVKGSGNRHDDGLDVRVFRIGNLATQEFIQLKLKDYYGRDEIPNLAPGRTCELEGYETGGYVGIPAAARKRAGEAAQTAEHRFVHEFVVFESAEIKVQPFTPADFLGRDALLQGRAQSEGGSAYIAGATWKMLVDNGTPWSKNVEGKTVEARGVIRTIGKTTTYRMENSGKANTARLVNLNDQIGRQVVLRGTLLENHGQFAFRYRGAFVQVENVKELAAQLETTGALQLTGVLDQVTVQNGRSLIGETETSTQFIVRRAVLKPCDALLAIERAEPIE